MVLEKKSTPLARPNVDNKVTMGDAAAVSNRLGAQTSPEATRTLCPGRALLALLLVRGKLLN